MPKAFCRSINIPQENKFLSILVWILLTMSRSACWVECFSRNPYCEEYKMCFFFQGITWAYCTLVYTTQVNSAFRAIWLVPLSRDIKYYSPGGFHLWTKCRMRPISSENKVTIWELVLNLSVNSGWYLPRRSGSVNIHRYSPPLRWIIVN